MKPYLLRKPDQTFWHLLFPYGGKEQVKRESKLGSKLVVQQFDDDWCQGLVDSFAEYMRQSSKHGSQPQPRPVSVEHSVLDAMFDGASEVDPKRVGAVCALHFATESTDDAPAGVYGLVEWARQFQDNGIEERPYLSPTTRAKMVMRDGTPVGGPFLFEVGLVSLPALDTIGSVFQRLTLGSFDLPEYVGLPTESKPTDEPLTLRVAKLCPGLIVRGATYMEEPEMEPNDLSPEMLTKLDEMIGAKISDMLKESEERAYKRACATMDERMADMRAAAAPTMGEPQKRSEEMPEPGEVEDSGSFVERALRIEREKVQQECAELIERRSLLGKNADEFIKRRISGTDVSDLLGDFGRLSVPQGHSGSVPVEGSSMAKSISDDAIMAEAAVAVVDGGSIKEKFTHLRADYIKRGFSIGG